MSVKLGVKDCVRVQLMDAKKTTYYGEILKIFHDGSLREPNPKPQFELKVL